MNDRASSMPPGRLRTPPVAAAPAAPAVEPGPPGAPAPAPPLVAAEDEVVAQAVHPWPELPPALASHDVDIDVALRTWGREQRLDREQADL